MFIYVHYSVSCIIVFFYILQVLQGLYLTWQIFYFLQFELDIYPIYLGFCKFPLHSHISSLNVKLHSSYIDVMPGARVKITKNYKTI